MLVDKDPRQSPFRGLRSEWKKKRTDAVTQPLPSLRTLLGFLSLAGVAFNLGACSETTMVVHSVKQVGRLGNDQDKGGYKVGNPYQVDGHWYQPTEDYFYSEEGEASWYGPQFHGKRTANGEIFDMNRLTAAHRTLPMPSFVQVTNLENGRRIKVKVNDRGPFANDRIIDLSRASAQALGFEKQGRTKVRVEILPEESRQAKIQALDGVLVAEAPAPTAAPVSRVETVSLAPLPVTPSTGLSTGQKTTTSVGGGLLIPATPPRTYAASAAAALGPAQYVQVGAFSDPLNADRLSARLVSLGPTVTMPVTMGSHVLHRVRLGPFHDRFEAEKALRETLASGYPEARIVED
ncbi:MAG: septal ring lytic transglycosylase RlpA family protein [Rhodospirillum sp.]|nr:septal ring lytic transglycosylase RlpA family protein [Rhodospirillum sp.]MCF8487713.1 septal ring lytic transglycosylase RlpA family protein [Rhodospirillum sp.]MCF8502412.1 septal ring lytic transglycosylase RlpA family protein [Rhodospirillum sp.]